MTGRKGDAEEKDEELMLTAASLTDKKYEEQALQSARVLHFCFLVF